MDQHQPRLDPKRSRPLFIPRTMTYQPIQEKNFEHIQPDYRLAAVSVFEKKTHNQNVSCPTGGVAFPNQGHQFQNSLEVTTKDAALEAMQDLEIDGLKAQLRDKDEDIFAFKLINAELKIENNRKDETIAALRHIIEKSLEL